MTPQQPSNRFIHVHGHDPHVHSLGRMRWVERGNGANRYSRCRDYSCRTRVVLHQDVSGEGAGRHQGRHGNGSGSASNRYSDEEVNSNGWSARWAGQAHQGQAQHRRGQAATRVDVVRQGQVRNTEMCPHEPEESRARVGEVGHNRDARSFQEAHSQHQCKKP